MSDEKVSTSGHAVVRDETTKKPPKRGTMAEEWLADMKVRTAVLRKIMVAEGSPENQVATAIGHVMDGLRMLEVIETLHGVPPKKGG